MPYKFENDAPKLQAHNIQGVEDKLRHEWIHDPAKIAHESDRLSLNSNKVEADRDKAVLRQIQAELSQQYGNEGDAAIFLKDAKQSIDDIHKQDPSNVDLPQLNLIQKRLTTG